MSVLTTIARGDASGVVEPGRAVAGTESEWRALWAVHAGPGVAPPPVDLGAVTIAAAFAGEKPSAGYAIAITPWQAAVQPGAARQVTLAVEQTAPGAGTVTATIVTSPFHIVAIPRSAGEVVWADLRPQPPDLRPALRLPVSDLRAATSGLSSSTGLKPRTAAALSYLAGPFSGALVLMAETTNQTVRFHAWQSIVGLGGLGIAVLAAYALAFAALFVSATAVSLMVGVAYVIWVVLILVWAICLWKAWSGARWKLPLVGDYAERFR